MSGRVSADEDEVRLARALVNPDKNIRDKTVKALQNYVKSLDVQEFAEMDMLKLWKALFYCFWYSDKVQIQDELAESLSKIIHNFSSAKLAIMFFRMFLRTMLREWHYIDQYRINKFYNLIRFFIREVFCYLKNNHEWNKKQVQKVMQCMEEEALHKKPNGIRFHIAEVYLSELYFATEGKVSSSAFEYCIQPFLTVLHRCQDNIFVDRVLEKVFRKCLDAYSSTSISDSNLFFTSDIMENVNLKDLIFEVAADESTREPNRRKIYEVHKEFQKTVRMSEKKRRTQQLEQLDEEQEQGQQQSKKIVKVHKNQIKNLDTPIKPNNIASSDSHKTTDITTPRQTKQIETKSSKKASFLSSSIPVEFIASKKYIGSKDGMVFKTGKDGLGYYMDKIASSGTAIVGKEVKTPKMQTKSAGTVGVRFGKNESKNYLDSIKSLKASTPPSNVSPRRTRSALKKK